MGAVYRQWEVGLQLLGATAVEDLLQEHVGTTLKAMRQAGLKVSAGLAHVDHPHKLT